MRKTSTILTLLITVFAMGSTDILNLKADYSAGAVRIQWQSSTEFNVKEYSIEKSSDNTYFNIFTSQDPEGSSSAYTVIDITPHTKDSVLYYRIIVKDYDGTEKISDTVSVKIETSGIGATWGSIKALFR